MTREEEYQLSLYQDMGAFNEKERVHLLRHRLNGKICVRKRVSASLLRIYRFLEKTKNPYIPEIYACIPDGDELIIIEEYIEGRTLADIIRERREEAGFAGNRAGMPRTEQAAQGNAAGQMHFAPKAADEISAGNAADEIFAEKAAEGSSDTKKSAQEILSEELTAQIGVSLCRALLPLHNAEPMIICRDIKAENIIIENPSSSRHTQNSFKGTGEALWPREGTAATGHTQSDFQSAKGAVWPEKGAEAERVQGGFAEPLGEDFSLKIVDFNISRQVKAGQTKDTQFMGTAQYAAPEQYGFLQTDNRTDIFSIGVLMNYCRTGEFPPDRMAEGALGAVIRKCTALDPADRYARAEELENSLLPLCKKTDSFAGKEHPSDEEPRPAERLTSEMPSALTDRSGSEMPPGPPNMQNARMPRRAVSAKDSFRIPGFRSRRPRNMLLACAGYLFITAMSFSVDPSTDAVPLSETWIRAEQFGFWCINILFVFLACNYRGLWNKIHLPAKKDGKPRLWACILVYVVLFFLWTFLCTVLENAFLQVSV